MRPPSAAHTGVMDSARALGRARSDVDVISRAGLPLHLFMEEAAAALSTVVPFVAGCFSTLDPATAMVAGTVKLDALAGRNDADVAWARIEYGGDDPTAMRRLVSTGRVSVGMDLETRGEIERSPRMAQLLLPEFDFHDEARVVCCDRAGAWGALSVFRGVDDAPFGREEVAILASLAPAITRGIRTGLLARTAALARAATEGPAVVIVDAHDRIVQASPASETLLRRLAAVPGAADPMTSVQVLISAARRLAAGDVATVPRVRARTADGAWMLLHAAPLSGLGERAGDVVVTIEEARPQDVTDLVAAAFGLTAREQQVVSMVLRGVDTRGIAAVLHLSPYTVQDHLKSIFDKAGVASRRELVARVYFDQYVDQSATTESPVP